jgi:hypothetical protein
MKKTIFFTFTALILISLFSPLSMAGAKADCPETPCPPGSVCIKNPLCAQKFEDLIDAFINFIFWVGIAIAPIMVLIAGFNLVTAGGDVKKVDTARKILLYTAIGLAIILMAKGLIAILNQILGVEMPTT